MGDSGALLSPSTTEAVLQRLGLDERPEVSLDGLDRVYLAWCRNVPFDNLRKRIHLVAADPGPLPGGEPEDFFASYLDHGTGGTCWPSSAALHALLASLGFDARRGSAAMHDVVAGPVHTHGTVIVRTEGAEYWVDSSMLSNHPLVLRTGEETSRDDAIRPMRAEPVERVWRVWWTNPAFDMELGCLLLDDDTSLEHYLTRYEASRTASPFNTGAYATRNFDGRTVTVAMGSRFERTADGATQGDLPGGLAACLVEELGYSEEIVASLPPDDPPPAT